MTFSIDLVLRRQADIERTLRDFEAVQRGGRTDTHEAHEAALKACGMDARTKALKLIEEGLRKEVARGRADVLRALSSKQRSDKE